MIKIINSSVSIVIVGLFPLIKYNIKWLSEKHILTNDDIISSIGNIEVNDNKIRIEVPNRYLITIYPNRFQIIGNTDCSEQIANIVYNILCHRMPEKIDAIGLNGMAIYEALDRDCDSFVSSYLEQSLIMRSIGADLTTELNFSTNPSDYKGCSLTENTSIKLLDLKKGENASAGHIQLSYNNHYLLGKDNIDLSKEIVMKLEETRLGRLTKFETLFNK